MAQGVIPGGLTMDLICVDDGGFSGTNAAFDVVKGAGSSDCSGSSAKNLRIFVEAITVLDPVSNSKVTLHQGMAMTKYDTGSGSNTPSVVYVVREINIKYKDKANQCFELVLGGHRVPFLQADHSVLSTAATTPVRGGNMTFEQVGMNGYSPNSEFNINTISRYWNGNDYGAIAAVGYNLDFVDDIQPEEVLSENPAIFETEPKDLTPLDIYYEASGSVPTQINENTISSAFPIGTRFLNGPTNGLSAYSIIGYNGNKAIVTGSITPVVTSPNTPTQLPSQFLRPDDLVIETDVLTVSGTAVIGEWEIGFNNDLMSNKFILPWHNCYTFKNGVESNRIRDNFNLPYISNGVKASTTLEQEYKEEHRKYGLIYSGIYNSTSGINNLNQFIAAEKITKDINPIYGSIQKLYSRDSDLVTLCEDKILRIQANKDALYNADGNSNVISTDRVLGQTIPFAGEYGISTNPESFAEESYRAYFTDRVRGAVMRLSKDGLTPISNAGMKDYFRDNLRNATQLIGSYDDRNNEYNLSIKTIPTYPVKIIGNASPVVQSS